jgi:hypothetical protein
MIVLGKFFLLDADEDGREEKAEAERSLPFRNPCANGTFPKASRRSFGIPFLSLFWRLTLQRSIF